MTKKSKVLKTGSADQGIPGVPLDRGARLDGPKTTQPYEFEGHLARDAAEVKAEETKIGFQRLANGISVPADLIGSICTHCGMVNWTKPERANEPCICYHLSSEPAWQRRPMTKKEFNDWSKRQTAARERYLAEAPARRAALATANRRRNEDDPDANRPFVNDPSRSTGRA